MTYAPQTSCGLLYVSGFRLLENYLNLAMEKKKSVGFMKKCFTLVSIDFNWGCLADTHTIKLIVHFEDHMLSL